MAWCPEGSLSRRACGRAAREALAHARADWPSASPPALPGARAREYAAALGQTAHAALQNASTFAAGPI
jgi:hypothetical protein